MADDKLRPSLLDRVVMALSPVAGDRRLAARMRSAVRMNYDAGRVSRRTASWRAPASSADAAATGGQRQFLRNLARDFVRNRPFASRGVSVIVSNVVGSGVRVSFRSDDEVTDKRVENLWAAHMDSPSLDAQGVLNFAAMQRVGFSSVVQDGEVLLRRRWRSGPYARGLTLPFQVEILEADFLDETKTAHGGNEVVDGVEYGPTGRIVAYHLYRQHPGTVLRRLDLKSDRVSADDVIHLRRLDRAGQTRGVSWFAPVMLTLGDLSDYQEAEILKQKVATLLAGVIESDYVDGAVGETSQDRANKAGLDQMEPGGFYALDPGERVSFTQPPQVNSYDQFTRQHLAAIAMGLGITYESLSGDMSRANFSSSRMGRMEMDKNVEIWQAEILVGQMCMGLERWFREALVLSPGSDFAPFVVDYTPQRRALIDPTREVGAAISKIQAGLSSRRREIRQLGYDPDVIDAENAADKQRPKTKE